MESWYEDHDNWTEQLKEFLAQHMVDPDQIPEKDLMFVSNLAAQMRRGDITLQDAVKEVHRYIRKEMGFHVGYDEETFKLEVAYGDLVDITEGFKECMLACDQPGIADAVVKLYANAELDFDDDGRIVGGEPGSPAMAVHAKGWFDVEYLSPDERKALRWSVMTALRNHADAS